MKLQIGIAHIALMLVIGLPQQKVDKKEKAVFSFAGIQYYHRFEKDDQHEYTPSGQQDLKRWTDMVTTHLYKKAMDGEALAATANAVLENYKANKGRVVRTDSVLRTSTKPAEHLIVVLFPRPEFIEAVFSRFKMQDGIGSALIYSHRIYGGKAGNEMSAWLEKNGRTTEKALMGFDAIPPPPEKKP